ncbi:MAG: acetylglutamate kinase [Vulcanimicrobiaceae bacterium]
MKYGGNAMGAFHGADPVLHEIAALHASGVKIVLVHGGGPEIDRQLCERGIVTERIDGLRVTDAPALETTEAVLCGTINKRLVRACLALGVQAVGVSGEDAGMLRSELALSASGRPLGSVGAVPTCDPGLIHALLSAGYLPIVAPLALDGAMSSVLNVNADSSAAAIAGALGAQAFVLISNVARVLANPDDPMSGIASLSIDEARTFLASDACRSSMMPKIEAAIIAVERGGNASYICAAAPNAIRRAFAGDATIIRSTTATLRDAHFVCSSG